ncbi:hypothetical protein KUCAC02_020401 [Chaenocephalus aceratus]|nr:hypothetical protein KUCAC02_020401 [Chaenocephalus aceratus]
MAVVRRGGELRRREPVDAHQHPDNFHHNTAAMSELKMGTSGFLTPTELCVLDIASMDGFYEMENPTENPSKAAEYLQELNKIIETQQGLLEKQRVRIDELELHMTDLCTENVSLKEQHQRHLATCRIQPGNNSSSLGAIKENATMQEK